MDQERDAGSDFTEECREKVRWAVRELLVVLLRPPALMPLQAS